MTTKTFEFATWPCSDKYADDPKPLRRAYRGLLWPQRVKGLNNIFNGVDKKKMNGHGFLCWDSGEDHENYIADKERQASVAVAFADALRGDAGGLVRELAVLSMETTLQILEAPLTEVARMTFVDTALFEKAKLVADKYVAYARREAIAAECGPGVNLDVEGLKIMIIIGWNTAEDQETFRKSDEVKEILKEMDQVGESRTISFKAILEEEAS